MKARGARFARWAAVAGLVAPLVATSGAVPASGPRHQATPEAAVHVFLWGSFQTTDRDLRLAKDAGFTWVKQRFEWRNIERDGKGRFEWGEPDRVLGAIEAAGLKVIARVDGHPGWSRADNVYPDDGPPDRLSDWVDYLSALASRYKGRMHAYQIWNEPNLAREWGRQRPDPRAYTILLQHSYHAIKRADPLALVISAGLAPTTEISDNARPDTLFLREMYAAGLRGWFDLLGAHAPGFRVPPETDLGTVAHHPSLNNRDLSPSYLRRAYAFRHVEELRNLMVDHGDGHRRMAILETGWTSDARSGSAYHWHAVSENQKAEYLARAFGYARAHWPWAALMTVIYLPDPTWTVEQEQLHWSIADRNGTPRPAYDALRRVLLGER